MPFIVFQKKVVGGRSRCLLLLGGGERVARMFLQTTATCAVADGATETCPCTSDTAPNSISGASSAAPAFLITAAAALFWA